MLWPEHHQYQTHTTSSRSKVVLISIAMKLPRRQIATMLLIIGLCQAKTSGRDLSKLDNSWNYTANVEDESLKVEDIEDTEEQIVEEEQSSEQLPILPPIILLDFANNTAEENVTSEEKSKRTVNDGIGYGLEKNSLQSSRYNYYFPAGKTGTTVSIEESISPFLPKTIIEKVQPTGQTSGISRPYGTHHNVFNIGSSFAQTPSSLQYLNPEVSVKSQSVFGLRTKLHKATASPNFGYQNYLSTPSPTASPYGTQNLGYRGNTVSSTITPSNLVFSSTESTRYVTANPLNYAGSRGNSFNYATSNSFSRQPSRINTLGYSEQRQNIQSNVNPNGYGFHSQNVETSTVSPLNFNSHFSRNPTRLPNLPKYTVENGIRYENKIFWKYPDGRVSDVPPATYVETSEYPHSTVLQQTKSPSSLSIYDSGSTESGIFSQRPVQFPTSPESARQEASPFISSDSLSSSLPQQQVYRLGYQNLVMQKQTMVPQGMTSDDAATSYSFSSSSSSGPTNTKQNRRPSYQASYSHQDVSSKYMVNNPNPEYNDVYKTEPTVNSTTSFTNFFTPSGELSSDVLSRYNPKVKNYLKTIFTAGGDSKKQDTSSKDPNNYSNLQYSDLLNYNPSISQYIKNPSSILNVQPTFVQAGNSLIPVIILRVDGASPIQPKTTSNINLKALLQQYLIQYANSIQELARPSTYDLGTEQAEKVENAVPSKSPLLDLIRLTQNDAREQPSYVSNSYSGKSSYETSNLEMPKTFDSKYTEQQPNGRQKVKNVQILGDSRFTSYKIKH